MKTDLSDSERESLCGLVSTACKGVSPLNFTTVSDYTTFLAEFAFDGGDIILHFYRSPEMVSNSTYWLQLFPHFLSSVAQEVFDAADPRLVAAYTEEMDSWWFRARGYQHILDKQGFVLRFLEKLDQVLDTTIAK